MTPAAAAKPSVTPSAVTPLASGRVFNFSAGPSVLPLEVLQQIQTDIVNIGGTGIGILEHSHRGKLIDRVFGECEADIRAIAGVPANYKILFMTGGASGQNHLLPMNFMMPGTTADYLVTGHWASQTWLQAKKLAGKPTFGNAHLACDTAASKHSTIPADGELKYSAKPAYVHYCSNNTLEGTQWHRTPAVPSGVPLVCDICSDIYSRPIDLTKFALVYAGAQKNLGPAGVTLVIAREDFIQSGNKDIADLCQYRTYVPDLSRPNTPPVFPIYVMGLMAKWILRHGGPVKCLENIAASNAAKAKLVYDVLDGSRFYVPHARREDRSTMNATFRLPSEQLTDVFVAEAAAQGLDGVRGHRNVGGIRASFYNAMPTEGCKALADFMREFERRHG